MDGRYCPSAVRFYPQERQPSFHNKKENQGSRVSLFSQLFTAVWLQISLLSYPIGLVAQTLEGHDNVRENTGSAGQNQPSYTVSVARLGIPAKAVKHLESAQKHFIKSDFAGATREIGQALWIDPDCAQAFSMRAFVKLAMKDFAGAIEDAHRSMALDPHDPAPGLALATAYNGTKEFSKAAQAAQQALTLNPNAWQGRLELAKSSYSQGECNLALNELDRIAMDFPDVHLVRANVLMCLGRTAEATEQFRFFLRQAPDDPRDEQIERITASTGGRIAAPTTKR